MQGALIRGARRSVPALMVACGLALAAGACGKSSNPSASPSASPSSTASSAEKQAADTAVAVYKGYLEVSSIAGETSNYDSPDLKTYIADPLLGEVVDDLYTKSKNGLVTTGRATFEVLGTEVHLDGRPTNVQLSVCYDGTATDTVRKSDGKSVSVPGQAKRYKVAAEVVKYDDGRWLIRKANADRNAPC